MKINQSVSKTAVGLLCVTGMLALASSAQASVTYDQPLAPITGTGNSSTGWTISSANGIDLSLRAQYNNVAGVIPNPLPSDITPNNGNGTFTFGTGSSTRAQWDFWFDVNPGSTDPDNINNYTLTINSSLGGAPVVIPVGLIGDNGKNGTEFQNAEDIGFSWIGYNPSLAAQYTFTLTASNDNGVLNSVDMTVNNGFAAVPEPTTVVAGALLLLPFGLSTLRALRKNRAV